jgi:TatA/E family protein of Tat protein translocase
VLSLAYITIPEERKKGYTMFGHPLELVVVFMIGLLVFGPKKLPEITRNVGRGINAFKKGLDGFTEKGETTEESEMLERRRELAALELQILEKKAELARQEAQSTPAEEPADIVDIADIRAYEETPAETIYESYAETEIPATAFDPYEATETPAATYEPYNSYTAETTANKQTEDATIRIHKDDILTTNHNATQNA